MVDPDDLLEVVAEVDFAGVADAEDWVPEDAVAEVEVFDCAEAVADEEVADFDLAGVAADSKE